jgi:hypothetical protein
MFDVLILMPEITKGMKSIGPKALLKIKNSTAILDHQIYQLKQIKGLNSINLATGFESERIKKNINKYSRINIVYNQNYESTNQTESILIYLKEYSPKNLLIIGNGILFKNTFQDCTKNTKSKIYFLDKPKQNFNIGCNDTPNIEYLFYDFPTPWMECVFLNNEAMESLVSLSKKHSLSQNYLFETINLLLGQNIKFHKEIIQKKNVIKISTIKDIQKAKLFI